MATGIVHVGAALNTTGTARQPMRLRRVRGANSSRRFRDPNRILDPLIPTIIRS
jgi:hypothetical protein